MDQPGSVFPSPLTALRLGRVQDRQGLRDHRTVRGERDRHPDLPASAQTDRGCLVNARDIEYTIDADAIAKGLLAMIPQLGEDYEVALKFGMLPAPLMDLMDRVLKEKAEEIFDAKYPPINDPKKYPSLAECWRTLRTDFITGFVRSCSRQVSTAMYAHADMVV